MPHTFDQREDMEVHDDRDVLALAPSTVVESMRDAIRMHADEQLQAPPRAVVPIEEGRLVFTVGAAASTGIGFRVYGVGTEADDEQLVALWRHGMLAALVTGNQLGIRRTAGIGAVATDLIAPKDARTLGLVGAGSQGCAHVREVNAVRELSDVRVFSRTPANRQAAASWISSVVDAEVRAVTSAEEAADGADLVTLATTNVTPVIDPDTIADGTHVTTIGPKLRGRHELPRAIADRARIIATDSLAQVRSYDPPFFLDPDGTHPMTELREIVDGGLPSRDPNDVTLFCSVGLAGTEPLLARALAA